MRVSPEGVTECDPPGLFGSCMDDVEGGVVVGPAAATYEQLYREHGQRLLGAVLAFAGDREIAMDAVSEAFAQGLRRAEEIRSPLAWIWRASFRIAAGMLKDRRVEDVAPRNDPYETPQRAWELVSALRKLPERQRAAVVIHYYADRPIKEVAAIIGSTSPAVKMHLNRARKRLRELLEEDRG